MTTRRTIAAILDKTPADALAGLSTSSFMRGDTAELHRIFAALPAHGLGSRREFLIQHHAMIESILLWAVEYWRTHSLMRSMTALIVDRESSSRDVVGGDLIYRANKAKLASLIEAMRQLCSDRGITFEDVTNFAEINVDEIDAQPVPAMVAEFVEMFGVSK